MKVLLAARQPVVRKLNSAHGAAREVASGAQEVTMELVTVGEVASLPRPVAAAKEV